MNTSRLSIIIGLLVIVVIVGVGWSLGISPKLAEADATVAQQRVVETQNMAQEAALVVLREQFAQLEVLRADYGTLQISIPGSTKGDEFIDQLKAAADATGVIILSVSLGEPQAYVPSGEAAAPESSDTEPAAGATDAGATGSGVVSGATTLTGTLFTVGIVVSVAGPSENIYNFVAAMQEGSRLFMVNDTTFSAVGEAGTGTLSGDILVVVNPQAAAAADAPTG
jgi:Tfp pilus assembly protein PilO